MLLRMAGYRPERDRLVLLGDYVDAGDPATWDALAYVRRLVQHGAAALAGNQELKLLALCGGGGAASTACRNGLPEPEAWVRPWLHNLPLYLDTQHYLFVHAGIRPGIALDRQSAADLTEIRGPFHHAPHGLNRTVVFGHTPTFKLGCPGGEPWLADRRIGIDTGAKHGCRLTLLELPVPVPPEPTQPTRPERSQLAAPDLTQLTRPERSQLAVPDLPQLTRPERSRLAAPDLTRQMRQEPVRLRAYSCSTAPATLYGDRQIRELPLP